MSIVLSAAKRCAARACQNSNMPWLFKDCLGEICPEDYDVSACQIYFLNWDNWPSDWLKPPPGTYQLIYGALPAGFTDVNPQDHLRGAHEHYLAHLGSIVEQLIGGFVAKPDGSLLRYARLLGTYVKPATYNVATILTQDPLRIWQRPWAEVIALVEPEACSSAEGKHFIYRGIAVGYRVIEQRQLEEILTNPSLKWPFHMGVLSVLKVLCGDPEQVQRWLRLGQSVPIEKFRAALEASLPELIVESYGRILSCRERGNTRDSGRFAVVSMKEVISMDD